MSVADPLVGAQVGDYQIVERIGDGGMGAVYRGVHPVIGARVAIKVLARELVGDAIMAERFITEARLANVVRHDALVDVIGFGTVPDGRPFLMMEFLDGQSLEALIAGGLGVNRLCELACEALQGLGALHAGNIIHRDIKPSNLFVTASGRLKLIDFGIAKLLGAPAFTRTGEAFGTPPFMAPEQRRSEAIDARVDLYAMGVVLYFGITHRLPFHGQPIDAALHAVAPEIPGVPRELDALVRKAMHPEASRRFVDAAQMEHALRNVLPRLDDAPVVVAGPAATTIPDAAAEVARFGVLTVRATPEAKAARARTTEHLGRYEVQGELGQGGAGKVIVGYDVTVDRRVALKVLHDTSGTRRDRLIAEARAMAKVTHPNVVTLYELGIDGEQLFLVMELVEGSDLAAWLRGQTRGWREIVDVFAAAGRGLAAAHDAGIVHRDFKPGNVLIGHDGRPRVSDFGLAGVDRGGTPAYMAPEQALEEPVDARCDQFAFCASLWEALFDELPYAGDDARAIAVAARSGTPREPADRRDDHVPHELVSVLRRGLAGTAAARYPSMPALLDALDEIAPRRGFARWWWAVGGIAAAGVAIAAVTLGGRESSPELSTAPNLADLRRLSDPGDQLRALARFAPDQLADPEIAALATDAARAGPVRVIETAAPITAIAMSDDAQQVAVATARSIAIYPLASTSPRVIAVPDARWIGFDGSTVVALVRDGIVEIDGTGAHRYRVRCPIVQHDDLPPITPQQAGPAHVAPDFQHLACPAPISDAAVRPMGVAIFDLHGRRLVEALQLVGFSPNGKRALVGDGARTWSVIDLATGDVLARRTIAADAIAGIGDEVVAIGEGNRLVVWHPGSTEEHSTEIANAIDQLVVTRTSVLARSRRTGVVSQWDLALANPKRWRVGGELLELVAGPDRILARTTTGLELRDRLGRSLPSNHESQREAELVTISPDGRIVATAKGASLAVWFSDLLPPAAYEIAKPSPSDVSVSLDGSRVVYRDGDHLAIRDLVTGSREVLPVAGSARLSEDGRVAAIAAMDHHLWLWQDRALRDLGAVDGMRLAFPLDRDRAIAMGRQVRRVTQAGATNVCGERPPVRTRGRFVIVADAGGAAVCDVTNGSLRELGAGKAWSISDDGSRVATIADGAPRILRTDDGTPLPFASVSGASMIELDRTGAHALASGNDALHVLSTTGAIALRGSSGATIAHLSGDGRTIASFANRQVLAWTTDHADRPRLLGRLATPALLDLVVSEHAVVTIHIGEDQHVAARWSLAPATVEQIQRWIRLAGG